jgi:hypothetical protein
MARCYSAPADYSAQSGKSPYLISSPSVRPRSAERRSRCRSPSESGSFTRASQSLSRTSGSPCHSIGSRQTQRGKLDHFLEVVAYQAVSEHTKREPGAGVDDGLDKGVIVFGLVKDGHSTITTVEDVVPHPTDGRSGSSWHPTIIKHSGLSVNISYVPFSASPFARAEHHIATYLARG